MELRNQIDLQVKPVSTEHKMINTLCTNKPRNIRSVKHLLCSCALILMAAVIPWKRSCAQINFQHGYVVTQSGDTLYGQIDNRDWVRNPEEIRFRTDSTSQSKFFTPHNLTAFSVGGKKYVSKIVTVDDTPPSATGYGTVPVSSEIDTVFLSVLVSGPVSLYYYSNWRKHFFISTSQGTTELISHEYVIERDGNLYTETNEKYKYRGQLAQLPNPCSNQQIKNLKYTRQSLTAFVAGCDGFTRSTATPYVQKNNPSRFYPKLSLGLSMTGIKIWMANVPIHFNYKINFTAGISGELILPGNRKSRSFFADLLFNSFSLKNNNNFHGTIVIYPYPGAFTEAKKFNGTIRNMNINVDYLKLITGFRYRLWAFQPRPFLETGISASTRLYYKAVGDYISDPNTSQGTGTTNSYTGKVGIVRPYPFSLGLVVGIGFQFRRFNLDVREEFKKLSSNETKINSTFLHITYSLARI